MIKKSPIVRFILATSSVGIACSALGQPGPSTGAFRYSSHAATASLQRSVKAVVEHYQAGLNASDFDQIRVLFAPDAVSEWNNKATVLGVEPLRQPYEELFKTTKFTTDFQYDAVDVYSDTAIVRTDHPVGQTELNTATGAKTLDFNREIFVLHRYNNGWKIVLYTFTTQPRQGEQ